MFQIVVRCTDIVAKKLGVSQVVTKKVLVVILSLPDPVDSWSPLTVQKHAADGAAAETKVLNKA